MINQRWQTDPERIAVKKEIKKIFGERVFGIDPMKIPGRSAHDGSKGHWLQKQFGLDPDAKNAPDFKGFECKDDTRDKTTFGDWSADSYLFFTHAKCAQSPIAAAKCDKCRDSSLSRPEFLRIFGAPNLDKGGRNSWSGTVFPKVDHWNVAGQRLEVTSDGDITAVYDFAQDQRTTRSLVPVALRGPEIALANWSSAGLQLRLERKFKVHGWFKCLQEFNGKGRYVAIKFGGPIEFAYWIEKVRSGTIYLDSGMYDTNPRPYSNWRAPNHFWGTMVEETYRG